MTAALFGGSDGPWAGNEPCAPPVGATPNQIRVHADAWHPTSTAGRPEAYAQQLCAGCDLLNACATYAVAHPQLEGIYGGLTEGTRKRLRGEAAA